MSKDCFNSLIDKHYQHNSDIIISCHQALQELYPGLIVRWARIYGHRWAFIHGSASTDINAVTLKVRLNDEYGLCVDNVRVIPSSQMDEIITTLRSLFNNGDYIQN
jgi:hypothetical protein